MGPRNLLPSHRPAGLDQNATIHYLRANVRIRQERSLGSELKL